MSRTHIIGPTTIAPGYQPAVCFAWAAIGAQIVSSVRWDARLLTRQVEQANARQDAQRFWSEATARGLVLQ